MTGEIKQGSAFLFNNCKRRHRRNALFNIFENLEASDIENMKTGRRDSCDNTNTSEAIIDCPDIAVMSPASRECLPFRNTQTTGNTEEQQVLQTESAEERLSGGTLPLCFDTGRPSCLSGICSSSSSTSPSSSRHLVSSSFHSSSSTSTVLSSPDMLTMTTVPEDSSDLLSPDITITQFFTCPRPRRNALHDLLETLTQEDLEKLKSLYQSSLSTNYSLKSCSDQTQSLHRSLHECTA